MLGVQPQQARNRGKIPLGSSTTIASGDTIEHLRGAGDVQSERAEELAQPFLHAGEQKGAEDRPDSVP